MVEDEFKVPNFYTPSHPLISSSPSSQCDTSSSTCNLSKGRVDKGGDADVDDNGEYIDKNTRDNFDHQKASIFDLKCNKFVAQD